MSLLATLLVVALLPLQAFAEPGEAVLTKAPMGKVVQTERGPVFGLYDTSLLNAGSDIIPYAMLPKQYDLRNVNGTKLATDVKNQNPYGDCWAFGAISSLESGLLVSGKAVDPDLSERHLVWYTYNGADDSADASLWAGGDTFCTDDDPYDAGGLRSKSAPTLMRWYGTVDEATAPLSSEPGMGAPDPDVRTESFLHVQNVVYLPEPNVYTFDELDQLHYRRDDSAILALKSFLMNNGALSVDYYADDAQAGVFGAPTTYWNQDTNAYYYFKTDQFAGFLANHEVSIVGWDDTFPKESFSTTPAGDGAWIIKNSWGSSFADGGYFYLSYYDTSFCEPAFFAAEDTEYRGAATEHVYDSIYQYDGAGFGDVGWDSDTQMWFANVFSARGYETVQAVSTVANAAGSRVELAVYKNPASVASPTDRLDPCSGELMWSMSETLPNAGYFTFDLGKDAFGVAPGDTFSVVSMIAYPDGRYQLSAEFSYTDAGMSKLVCAPGQSFYADERTGGKSAWYDFALDDMDGMEANMSFGNALLKAYTTASSAPIDPAPDPDPDPKPLPQPAPESSDNPTQPDGSQGQRGMLAAAGDDTTVPFAAGSLITLASAAVLLATVRCRRSDKLRG